MRSLATSWVLQRFLAWVAFGLAACTHAPPHSPPAGSVPQVVERTPPRQTIAVIGDFGVGDVNEAEVAALVESWAPEAILTVGDNNYENGEAATLDDNVGQFYHAYIAFGPHYRGRFVGRGAAEPRFFPTLGNHDWRARGAQPYLDYFALPGNGRYYRQRLGAIEVFAVDSDPHEPDGIDVGSTQAGWLKAALADSSATWKVVTFHHPPYSSGHHGDHAVMQWPFADWGADVVLCGHDHHYERLRIGSVAYRVVGTGGARLRPCLLKAREGATEQKVYSEAHGALRMSAEAEGLRLTFVNVRHQVVDEEVLAPRPPAPPPT